MTDSNFLTIPGFLRTRLDLKGIDLLIVAIIYGFSQDGKTEFKGTTRYIAEWCGTDKKSVHRHLQALVQAGVIIKREETINGVKFCRYRFNPQAVKNDPTGDKMSLGVGTKCPIDNIGDIDSHQKTPYGVEKSGEPSFSPLSEKDESPEKNSGCALDAEQAPNPPVAPDPPSPKRFVKPTVHEVGIYLQEKGIRDIDPETFWNFYESKGWKVGSTPMKNWHAAVATWKKRREEQAHGDNHRGREDRRGEIDTRSTCADDYNCSF